MNESVLWKICLNGWELKCFLEKLWRTKDDIHRLKEFRFQWKLVNQQDPRLVQTIWRLIRGWYRRQTIGNSWFLSKKFHRFSSTNQFLYVPFSHSQNFPNGKFYSRPFVSEPNFKMQAYFVGSWQSHYVLVHRVYNDSIRLFMSATWNNSGVYQKLCVIKLNVNGISNISIWYGWDLLQ